MIRFTVKIQDDHALAKALSGFGWRRVNRAMGMRFRDITLRNFGQTGAHRASPWPPYARNYPKWGKKKGDPATLIRTGRLMGSIRVDSNNDSYAEVYSEGLPYADRHQFGHKQTPARPYYPMLAMRGMGSEQLTPYAVQELETAAMKEIQAIVANVR